MGYYQSAYFAYGLHIPVDGPAWQESERIDTELQKLKPRCPDIGFLTAGDYDRDMVFLVTKSDEVQLGSYGRGSESTAEQRASWDAQLAAAVHALGLGETPDLEPPGWLCIPDLS